MNTMARVAAVCQNREVAATVDENRARMMERLRGAMQCRPDLVVLPETFTSPQPFPGVEKVAEPVPGPTVEAAGKIARENRCYVVCPILTSRQGRFYNSAVVIGRDGQVAGVYDKRHPVTSTHDYTVMEYDMTPGEGEGVFDLDFGRVGIRICFDLGFASDWQLLADRGVRLAIWPSAYNGGFPLQAYAALHEMYVVSAVSTSSARVIDPCGRIVDRTEAGRPIIWRDINLDYLVCHTDFNYGAPAAIEKAYGGRVRVTRDDDTGSLLIEPLEKGISSEAIRQQIGLEPRRQYFARHQRAYDAMLSGQKPEAQVAAHGCRPMYSVW